MPATVVQLNISRGGIPKLPISHGIVTPLGLEGDSCAHPAIHGGPQQALLLVMREAVDELIARGYPLFYGALGENITTEGLDRKSIRAGQRYRIGSEVMVEITKRRSPCATLDVYGSMLRADIWDKRCNAHDPTSPRWGLAGFYASVVRTGTVLPGAPILLVEQDV